MSWRGVVDGDLDIRCQSAGYLRLRRGNAWIKPHDCGGGALTCNLQLARRPQPPVDWFPPRPFVGLDPLRGLEWSLPRTPHPLKTLECHLRPPDTSHGGFWVARRGPCRLSAPIIIWCPCYLHPRSGKINRGTKFEGIHQCKCDG